VTSKSAVVFYRSSRNTVTDQRGRGAKGPRGQGAQGNLRRFPFDPWPLCSFAPLGCHCIVRASVDALNRTGIPVTLWEWHYVPQLGEWQLIVATPWYDSRGLRVTYDRIIKALQQTGLYEDVPLRRSVGNSSASDTMGRCRSGAHRRVLSRYWHLWPVVNGQQRLDKAVQMRELVQQARSRILKRLSNWSRLSNMSAADTVAV
jgi:hypothetical protein